MTGKRRVYVAIIATGLCLGEMQAKAQAPQPASRAPQSALQERAHQGLSMADQASSMAGTPAAAATMPSKPTPGTPVSATGIVRRSSAPSMLDEPANEAQIQVAGDQLSINATNASLSEVIRQVASKTGMQVEGNSRDERVFGIYGPGSPPDVLSALLYDSGYNVMMVGSTDDGAPRKLLLSARQAGVSAAPGSAVPARSTDEDDDDAPAETPAPAPQPGPGIQAAPATPSAPGQPRTPQQMLEELQRMHQGQQPTDLPHDQN